MSKKENAEKETHEEATEKELLDEIVDAIDVNLADIRGKLDTIEILLFIIALPVIISFILIILLLIGSLTIPWPV